jgi:hypothetical protein
MFRERKAAREREREIKEETMSLQFISFPSSFNVLGAHHSGEGELRERERNI